jgi:hypothetical protein
MGFHYKLECHMPYTRFYSTLHFQCVHDLCTILPRQKKYAARHTEICLEGRSQELMLGYLNTTKVMNKRSQSPIYHITRFYSNTADTQHKNAKLSTRDNSHLDSQNVYTFWIWNEKIVLTYAPYIHFPYFSHVHVAMPFITTTLLRKLNVLFSGCMSTCSTKLSKY